MIMVMVVVVLLMTTMKMMRVFSMILIEYSDSSKKKC